MTFREYLTEGKAPSKNQMKNVGVVFNREMDGEYGLKLGKDFKTYYDKKNKYVTISYPDIDVTFRSLDDAVSIVVKNEKTQKTLKSFDVSKKSHKGIDSTLVNAIYAMFSM